MIKLNFKANNDNAGTVLSVALVMIVIGFVFGPLVLLAGVNFILEALALAEIPYTISTWFGALLVILTVKSSN